MINVFILAASLVIALSASAQSRISSANYKMPREAAKAKATNADNLQFQAYVASDAQGLASDANYKNAFVKLSNSGGLIPIIPVEYSNNALASASNYKTGSVKVGARKSANQIPVQPAKPTDIVVMNY